MRQTLGLCCVKASMIESRTPVAASSVSSVVPGRPARTASHGLPHVLAFMRTDSPAAVTSADEYEFWPGSPQ